MRGCGRSNPLKVTRMVFSGFLMIYEKRYLIIRLVHNRGAFVNVYGDGRWSDELGATTKGVKVS